MAGFLQDDSRLHKLCQDGNLKKVTEHVRVLKETTQVPQTAAGVPVFVAAEGENIGQKLLDEKLNNRKGVFGYTPLHEAVASGHSKVLSFLLGEGGDVNCRANSGYTPLHLAASSGHADCVRVLLRKKADISMTDEYGKTPKQTAELSSKNSIVRLLRSEGMLCVMH